MRACYGWIPGGSRTNVKDKVDNNQELGALAGISNEKSYPTGLRAKEA